MVVSREEKKQRYFTFCVYFAPKGSRASQKALKAVCDRESGRNVVRCVANKTQTRVELTWPQPVTHDSPRKLLREAREKLPTFAYLGQPTPVGEPVGGQDASRRAARGRKGAKRPAAACRRSEESRKKPREDTEIAPSTLAASFAASRITLIGTTIPGDGISMIWTRTCSKSARKRGS